MIAELSKQSFNGSTLGKKIDYHEKKINNGVATVLYTSSLAPNLNVLKKDLERISLMNPDIVKPYMDVSLNFNKGENLSNELLLEISQEYLNQLGYEKSEYTIIKHTDTDKPHLHILFTKIDTTGKKIPDSMERVRSQKISRELEVKYNLKETKYNEFNTKKSFGDIKAREFYFYNALQKALKSHLTKERLTSILKSHNIELIPRNNELYEILLGKDYNTIGEILKKGGFLNTAYKDELLTKLDNAFSGTTLFSDFKGNLDESNVYIRMLTKGGKSYFVYGLKDVNVYFKDSSFPQKYRASEIFSHFQPESYLLPSTQKNYIYESIFISLNQTPNYNDFKDQLKKDYNVSIIEFSNNNGVYGISYYIDNIVNFQTFQGADISKNFSYTNIDKYFNSNNTHLHNTISNSNIILGLKESLDIFLPFVSTTNKSDFELSRNRKRRKRGRNI